MDFFSAKTATKNPPAPAASLGMDTRKKIVKIENLSVIYNPGKSFQSTALQDINLEIYPQEYVIFFGPSGCGKSTLLNIIAGLEIPSKGKVLVDDIDLSHLSSNALSKFHQEKISMIFQSYNLIPTLDVLDNVILPQIFQRIKQKSRRERGLSLLKKLGLEELERRLPQELSGGQQQRVSIARALVNNPPVILADEAVGNLDSVSAKNVLDILSVLNNEDEKTIIAVTHNPEHLFYADRVFYMKDGRIIKVEVNKKKIKASSKSDYPAEAPDRRRTPLDLLLQAYPDLSAMQLHTMLAPFKAKMLVGYLMSQLESQEITNLEKIITDRLLEKITAADLLHALDDPIEQGGMGLNKNIATRFAQTIEEVVEKANFLDAGNKKAQDGSLDPIVAMIDQTRHSLLDEYKGELTFEQIEALNKGIEFRILNKISRTELQEYFDRPLDKGGVGLNRKTSKNFARKLELLMLLEYGK